MAIIDADTEVPAPFEQDLEKQTAATQRYFDDPRFAGIIRLYSARQVVEQRGTIPTDYTVARKRRRPSIPACASFSRRRRASPPSGRTLPARQ